MVHASLIHVPYLEESKESVNLTVYEQHWNAAIGIDGESSHIHVHVHVQCRLTKCDYKMLCETYHSQQWTPWCRSPEWARQQQ